MKKILIPALSLAGFTPLVALATDTTIGDIMYVISNLLSFVTPILVTVAVIYFIWTVIKYTIMEDEKKKEAKKQIVPALVGLFLIVAFWGILSVVSNTFRVGPEQLRNEHIPCVPNPVMGISC